MDNPPGPTPENDDNVLPDHLLFELAELEGLNEDVKQIVKHARDIKADEYALEDSKFKLARMRAELIDKLKRIQSLRTLFANITLSKEDD